MSVCYVSEQQKHDVRQEEDGKGGDEHSYKNVPTARVRKSIQTLH